MKKLIGAILGLCLLATSFGGRSAAASTPPEEAVADVVRSISEAETRARQETHRLFALHRSTNANMVAYDAVLRDGRFDPEDPIQVYWVMLAKKGGTQPLTRLERKRAYGIEMVDVGPDRVIFALVSLPTRLITATLGPDGPEALMDLQGQRTRLQSVFVAAKDGSLVPGVRYVEATGTSLATGETVTERFVP